MKPRKQKTIWKRIRELLAQQVAEYASRYYPEMGEVEAEISPCGTFASVRSAPKRKRPR